VLSPLEEQIARRCVSISDVVEVELVLAKTPEAGEHVGKYRRG
jgi:hypothetical protein